MRKASETRQTHTGAIQCLDCQAPELSKVATQSSAARARTDVVVVVVVMLVVVVVVVDVVVVVVVVEVVVVEVVVVVVVLVVVVVVVVLHKFLFNKRMNTQNRQRRAQCFGSFVNTNSSTRRDKQRGSKDPTLCNV